MKRLVFIGFSTQDQISNDFIFINLILKNKPSFGRLLRTGKQAEIHKNMFHVVKMAMGKLPNLQKYIGTFVCTLRIQATFRP